VKNEANGRQGQEPWPDVERNSKVPWLGVIACILVLSCIGIWRYRWRGRLG
jgi:hypothetical protein